MDNPAVRRYSAKYDMGGVEAELDASEAPASSGGLDPLYRLLTAVH